MELGLSQEQQMLRDSVSRYLEKAYDFDARQALVASDAAWSDDAWAQFAELGLMALPFPEERGGLGGSISDCVAFAESFGKHLVIEPYIASTMCAGVALAASEKPVAQEWIEKLAAGEALAAFAYEEGRGTSKPEMIAMSAKRGQHGYLLSGEKRLVIAGAQADVLVVVARIEGTDTLGLFLVASDAPGLESRAYTTIDGRSAADMRFSEVAVTDDAVLHDNALEPLKAVLANAMIVQSAEAVGAMGALLTITGEYAMTRKQFGKPIAMFQAVSHRLADMKIAYTKAYSTLTYTTALAAEGAASARDIAVLKGQVGKLGRELGEAAIQTHGGVGLTDELSVGHYHKRILAFDAQFGDHTYHLRTLGQR
ncbi:MAG: acyl-CoA dehydrogenase family protein [Pseudomonadota bacterium]